MRVTWKEELKKILFTCEGRRREVDSQLIESYSFFAHDEGLLMLSLLLLLLQVQRDRDVVCSR